ncbi:MAG TPA: DNA recombination protein RmuC [Steroidobacteraceae bacterium]|jgi:DNA recombination protein RmuC|nr:DNA recombination protein RmuC [Steroidobacteraceae bacterium]
MNSAWLIAGLAALAAAIIGYLIGTLRAGKHASELGGKLAAANERLSSETELRARTAELLAQSEAQVRSAVESASRIALNANSETFLKLAREVFGRDQEAASATLAARELAIAQLVEPIKAALLKQEEQTQALERERRETFGVMRTQIESMSSGQAQLQRETRNLVTALRRPEVRGRWGELTLRRVVELSGLSEHCDFTEQAHVEAGERGALRPDLLVHMPEARDLVVDAKTPLDAYLDAIEAQDDATRSAALARHAMQVEQRVRELGQKSYWEQFEQSPEFAVLFLPGDQFLSAALAERPDLLENALKQSIIIATPSTLMALLKVVAYGWRQAAASENAAEIRELGAELHKRLSTFVGHLQKVGRSLGNALDSYNAAVGSFERNVTPQARRFTELGATADTLPSIEPLDQPVRLLAGAPSTGSDDAPDTTRTPS